jgi:hypothetical protein
VSAAIKCQAEVGRLSQIGGNQEEENSQGYDPYRPNLKAAVHAAQTRGCDATKYTSHDEAAN